MTGKDLIIFILQHNLLDTEFFTNGKVPGLITRAEAAVKFGVGVHTIDVWMGMGRIQSAQIGDECYIFDNALDPRPKATKLVISDVD